MKYLIIGADPGHTIGLCAYDFEGKIVHCSSLQNAGIEKTVALIESLGTPSIIATDVSPAPEFVQKLSSYFNVKLYVPKKILRENYKRELLYHEEKKAGKKLAKNAHERDALTAAVLAWRDSQNLIRSALATKEKNSQKIAHLMLQGYRKESAQIELSPKKEPTPQKQKSGASPLKTKIIPPLQIELERKNIQLLRRVDSLEQENARLKEKLHLHESGMHARISREKELRKLKVKISRLQSRLQDEQKKTRFSKPPAPKKMQSPPQEENKNSAQTLKGLNSLDKLARLVGEYRKGRKNLE